MKRLLNVVAVSCETTQNNTSKEKKFVFFSKISSALVPPSLPHSLSLSLSLPFLSLSLLSFFKIFLSISFAVLVFVFFFYHQYSSLLPVAFAFSIGLAAVFLSLFCVHPLLLCLSQSFGFLHRFNIYV